MMVVVHEEVNDHMQVIKGKRTKRQRPASPITLAMASTSSGVCDEGESKEAREGAKTGEFKNDNSNNDVHQEATVTSTGSSADKITREINIVTTEEEEDMANCLMLLAQGHQTHQTQKSSLFTHNYNIEKKPSASSSSTLGLDVYPCKTCNKSFPSFQALGGHRASHKKPKIVNNDQEKKSLVVDEKQKNDERLNSFLSLQVSSKPALYGHNNKKPDRIHECSICGAEFSSGQALGGHMRRHRSVVTSSTPTGTRTATTSSIHMDILNPSKESKRQRNSLQLDLNLPAPDEDDRFEKPKFSFMSKDQILVFSASSLVDCHY